MFTSREFRGIARNKLKGRWGRSVVVSLLAALLGGVPGGSSGGTAAGSSASSSSMVDSQAAGSLDGFTQNMEQFEDAFAQMVTNPVVMGVFWSVLSIILCVSFALYIVGAAVELGHNKYYVDLCQNGEPGVGTLFSRFSIFLRALGLRLFTSLFVLLWTLLLIIPGIIASYRYAMAPYIMAQDPTVGIREAVDRSKQMMQGRKWQLFCLQFSFIGWALLCALTLGVGNLWLRPYMQAATAAFYLDASGQGIPMEPAV